MSEVCGADSGDGYTCTMPLSQHGLDHFNRKRTPRDWPDPERIEQHRLNAGRPIGKPRGVAKKIAVKAVAAHDKSQDKKKGPVSMAELRHFEPDEGPDRPLARKDDPSTAHEAIARYEPKRESAKGRVLAHLRANFGQWIDAPDFTAPHIGGFAGTRRLRELRESGWPIETRPKPGTTNTWQHRLVEQIEEPVS